MTIGSGQRLLAPHDDNDAASTSKIRYSILKDPSSDSSDTSEDEVDRRPAGSRHVPKRASRGAVPEALLGKSGPRDYETLHPDNDAVYRECDPNARVWNVFNEEAEIYNTELLSETTVALDSTLIFAGLFSAVLSTFVGPTSELLPRDTSSVTVELLSEMALLLRSQINGTQASDPITAADVNPRPDIVVVWVNGLWFASLCFSLATALFAVLAQQWLRQYTSRSVGLTARDRSLLHESRVQGFEKWRVRTLIGLLPTLLHIALLLFLAGLSLHLSTIHESLAIVVGAMSLLITGGYLFFFITPLLVPNCPFHTPITDIFQHSLGAFAVPFLYLPQPKRFFNWSQRKWVDNERDHILGSTNSLMEAAVVRLCATTANRSAQRIAQQALGALPSLLKKDYHRELWRKLYPSAGPSLDSRRLSTKELFKQAERWLRTWHVINIDSHENRLDMPDDIVTSVFRQIKSKHAVLSPHLALIIPRSHAAQFETVVISDHSTELQHLPYFLIRHHEIFRKNRAPHFLWKHLYGQLQLSTPDIADESLLQFAGAALKEWDVMSPAILEEPTRVITLLEFFIPLFAEHGWFDDTRVQVQADILRRAERKRENLLLKQWVPRTLEDSFENIQMVLYRREPKMRSRLVNILLPLVRWRRRARAAAMAAANPQEAVMTQLMNVANVALSLPPSRKSTTGPSKTTAGPSTAAQMVFPSETITASPTTSLEDVRLADPVPPPVPDDAGHSTQEKLVTVLHEGSETGDGFEAGVTLDGGSSMVGTSHQKDTHGATEEGLEYVDHDPHDKRKLRLSVKDNPSQRHDHVIDVGDPVTPTSPGGHRRTRMETVDDIEAARPRG